MVSEKKTKQNLGNNDWKRPKFGERHDFTDLRSSTKPKQDKLKENLI